MILFGIWRIRSTILQMGVSESVFKEQHTSVCLRLHMLQQDLLRDPLVGIKETEAPNIAGTYVLKILVLNV